MKHRGNYLCPDVQTNMADRQPENIMLLPALLSGIGIKSEKNANLAQVEEHLATECRQECCRMHNRRDGRISAAPRLVR